MPGLAILLSSCFIVTTFFYDQHWLANIFILLVNNGCWSFSLQLLYNFYKEKRKKNIMEKKFCRLVSFVFDKEKQEVYYQNTVKDHWEHMLKTRKMLLLLRCVKSFNRIIRIKESPLQAHLNFSHLNGGFQLCLLHLNFPQRQNSIIGC